ncbi:DUF4113 domain-containing protein [Escherichia coli]
MGSCAAPSAKGDDKFITTDYLQQCLSGYRRDQQDSMMNQSRLSPRYTSRWNVLLFIKT